MLSSTSCTLPPVSLSPITFSPLSLISYRRQHTFFLFHNPPLFRLFRKTAEEPRFAAVPVSAALTLPVNTRAAATALHLRVPTSVQRMQRKALVLFLWLALAPFFLSFARCFFVLSFLEPWKSSEIPEETSAAHARIFLYIPTPPIMSSIQKSLYLAV